MIIQFDLLWDYKNKQVKSAGFEKLIQWRLAVVEEMNECRTLVLTDKKSIMTQQ
jgi:hypothetical protein